MESKQNQAAGDVLLNYKPPSEQSDNKMERKVTPEDLFAARGHESGNLEPNDAAHAQPNGVLGVDAGNDNDDLSRTWEGIQDTTEFGPLKYNMNHKKRGCFLIFSQENFDSGMSSRKGTKTDAYNIWGAALNLGFEFIKTFHDLKKSEILYWLNSVSKASHDEYDCFGCAILTHGEENDVLYAKDAPMELKDFTEPFTGKNCRSLVGKPKLFFVQACRGFQRDKGVQLPQGEDVMDFGGKKTNTIPNEADFLIAQATVPGYVAWLNKTNGSWFIQSLCICIHPFSSHMDIIEIMTMVNNMVAYRYKSSTDDKKHDDYKQMPSFTSRLTAKVFFKKTVDKDTVQQNESQIQMVADEIEVHPHQPNEITQAGIAQEETMKPKKKSSLMSRIRKSFRLRRGTNEK